MWAAPHPLEAYGLPAYLSSMETLPETGSNRLPQDEIAALAARYRRANGSVMQAVNALGGRVENRFEALPDSVKDRIEETLTAALGQAYRLAGSSHRALPDLNRRGHLAASVLTGAAGGAGGLASALAELPVTVTMIFRAIQKVAAEHGFDPGAEDVRLECLAVFGSGGPLAEDDGVNSSFLGARLTLNGATVRGVIAAVAPRLLSALGPKLAAQAVPVIGAVTGAGVNYAYMNYYQEMAHIRFALKRLGQAHDPQALAGAFRTAIGRAKG